MDTYAKKTITLLYDGDCGFCLSCVNLAKSWGVECDMQPYQKFPLERIGLSSDECAKSVKLVQVEEVSLQVFSGAEAIGVMLRNYSHNMRARLIGKYILVPLLLPLHERLYSFVAKNRTKLPLGKKVSCAV